VCTSFRLFTWCYTVVAKKVVGVFYWSVFVHLPVYIVPLNLGLLTYSGVKLSLFEKKSEVGSFLF
jgi:hypothetical protein